MSVKNYDVIIIGARIAGSTLAYELAKAGYEVLLVDRSTFPSDILSTHNFFNNSVAMLREMGVLEKLIQTGTPMYNRAHIQMDEMVVDGIFPEVDGETHCLCVRRKHLDHILFEHACNQERVTAIEGFRVTELLYENDTVSGIVGMKRDGITEQLTAKLVVGADGRNSTLRRLVNSERQVAVPTDFASYVGYFSHFRQEGEPCVEFYKIKENIAIVFPTSDNLVVIGIMFPLANKEWSEKFRNDPEASMRELVEIGFSSTTFPERLREAALDEPMIGLLGYDNDWFQGMGKGWALVGDSVSFKDPAVGQGMHDAIYGARLLRNILSESDDWASDWQEMSDRYQTAMESKMMSRYQLACQITKNTPVTMEQSLVNQLIGSHPVASQAFLGIYNYANEPEMLQQTIMGLLGRMSSTS